MTSLKFLAAALILAATPAAAELPDLGGRAIKAVTENAYVPLNFADPKSGEGIGWEYDAVNEIAKRLHLKVEWNLSSWDPMSRPCAGSVRLGMDGIKSTRSKHSGRLRSSYLRASCWCRRKIAASLSKSFAADESFWSGPVRHANLHRRLQRARRRRRIAHQTFATRRRVVSAEVGDVHGVMIR